MSISEISFNIEETKYELNQQKISHLFHLVMSVITVGLWVFVWALVYVSVSIERKRLKAKLKRLVLALHANNKAMLEL